MPYYKTTVSIDVLTEEPIPDHYTLEDIGYEIEQGDWVGYNIQSKQVELTPKEIVEALKEAGSDPDFFQLDDEGNKAELAD